MIMTDQIILVLFVHWFADFVLQTRRMATNKSISLKWLTTHVITYTIPLFLFGWKFAIFNGAAHFVVDFFTSRASSYFYKRGNIHAFFLIVGFDQFLHCVCLIKGLEYL